MSDFHKDMFKDINVLTFDFCYEYIFLCSSNYIHYF